MPGIWTALTNQPGENKPSFDACHPLLLTDGRVMAQDNNTASWYALTPDEQGAYENGTWVPLASSTGFVFEDGTVGDYGPGCFGSAVLADGRVLVVGGEYNLGGQVSGNTCGIYDPVLNEWHQVESPPFPNFTLSDAPVCVLTDGSVLVGATNPTSPTDPATATAIFEPTTGSWSAGPPNPSSQWEATWTLLPDGSVLSPSVNQAPATYRYYPGTTPVAQLGQGRPLATPARWESAGDTPAGHELSSPQALETGPALLMPDGTVIAFGAIGHTAIYAPATGQLAAPGQTTPSGIGTWSGGPDFPVDPAAPGDGNVLTTYAMADAPAALLPNGTVIGLAGPLVGSYTGPPTVVVEFTPAQGTAPAQLEVQDASEQAAFGGPIPAQTQGGHLLVLPTGSVLMTLSGPSAFIYHPASQTPPPAAVPTITSVSPTLLPGGTGYRIEGHGFNGLSQASSFGDDAANATNYPLVRIENVASGHVAYCRTHDHSTMAVVTGSEVVSTLFDVPADVEHGPSNLYVVANGVPSAAWHLDGGIFAKPPLIDPNGGGGIHQVPGH
jgi:hypothetical protein